MLGKECRVDLLQKEPVEAVFRSMLLVLLDNATAEYAFVATFFPDPPQDNGDVVDPPPSATSTTQSMTVIGDRIPSYGTSVTGSPPMPRRSSLAHSVPHENTNGMQDVRSLSKEQQVILANTWKQIMEPAMTYCEVGILLEQMLFIDSMCFRLSLLRALNLHPL